MICRTVSTLPVRVMGASRLSLPLFQKTRNLVTLGSLVNKPVIITLPLPGITFNESKVDG
jgi:hypothetical protein